MMVIFVVVVSALLYAAAFFAPQIMWWGALVSLYPLYVACRGARSPLMTGFLWGLIAYGLHSWWIVVLLKTKSGTSNGQIVFIFTGLVVYFALTSALCLKVASYVLRRCSSGLGRGSLFLVLINLYFIALKKYLLSFVGTPLGYPFFSPLIPWASSGVGRRLIMLMLCPIMRFVQPNQAPEQQYQVFYCAPEKKHNVLASPDLVAERFYYKLASLRLHDFGGQGVLLVLAPESAYPFALNKAGEWVAQWGEVMPKNAYLIMGGLREEEKPIFKDKMVYQSAFFINQGRIMQICDKWGLVPFVESIPSLWRCEKVKNLFNKGKNELAGGKEPLTRQPFSTGALTLEPYLCSELFFYDFNYAGQGAILWLVNDSWFAGYFRKLLENYAYITHVKTQKPIVYVTHSQIIFFKKNQSHAINNAKIYL